MITHCDNVGKWLFHTLGEGGNPTHISTTRAGIASANTYSTLLFQKRWYLIRRRAYRKEKPKDYLIVSEPLNVSAALCVPHVFFPDQAYLSYYRDESNGKQRQRRGSPHHPGLESSRKNKRPRSTKHNTGRNSSFRGRIRRKLIPTFIAVLRV